MNQLFQGKRVEEVQRRVEWRGLGARKRTSKNTSNYSVFRRATQGAEKKRRRSFDREINFNDYEPARHILYLVEFRGELFSYV